MRNNVVLIPVTYIYNIETNNLFAKWLKPCHAMFAGPKNVVALLYVYYPNVLAHWAAKKEYE